jgi:predicted GNAT family N-acyltransferase
MIRIKEASWENPEEQAQLRLIRSTVFIREQGVPESMEWDEYDRVAIHYLALEDSHPVGCVRLLPTGHVGRMAVLAERRRQGIGLKLLEACEAKASELKLEKIRLSAQVRAIPFYESAGYALNSETYMDAGIPHRDMYRKL